MDEILSFVTDIEERLTLVKDVQHVRSDLLRRAEDEKRNLSLMTLSMYTKTWTKDIKKKILRLLNQGEYYSDDFDVLYNN